MYAALAAQLLAAVHAALFCGERRVVHGLAAALVAGVLADAMPILGGTVGSCPGGFSMHGAACPTFADWTFIRIVFEQTLVKGAVLAILGSTAVAGVHAARRGWPVRIAGCPVGRHGAARRRLETGSRPPSAAPEGY
ncbi:MAG TPA: hypothetical protein VMU39_09250 [Solirubrobacteraceae bacterium]|nr:hypothetical protein [Solirubrobacteraceae bacterium]